MFLYIPWRFSFRYYDKKAVTVAHWEAHQLEPLLPKGKRVYMTRFNRRVPGYVPEIQWYSRLTFALALALGVVWVTLIFMVRELVVVAFGLPQLVIGKLTRLHLELTAFAFELIAIYGLSFCLVFGGLIFILSFAHVR